VLVFSSVAEQSGTRKIEDDVTAMTTTTLRFPKYGGALGDFSRENYRDVDIDQRGCCPSWSAQDCRPMTFHRPARSTTPSSHGWRLMLAGNLPHA